jgi:hypothetical protein
VKVPRTAHRSFLSEDRRIRSRADRTAPDFVRRPTATLDQRSKFRLPAMRVDWGVSGFSHVDPLTLTGDRSASCSFFVQPFSGRETNSFRGSYCEGVAGPAWISRKGPTVAVSEGIVARDLTDLYTSARETFYHVLSRDFWEIACLLLRNMPAAPTRMQRLQSQKPAAAPHREGCVVATVFQARGEICRKWNNARDSTGIAVAFVKPGRGETPIPLKNVEFLFAMSGIDQISSSTKNKEIRSETRFDGPVFATIVEARTRSDTNGQRSFIFRSCSPA